MPVIFGLVVMYMIYENTFNVVEKEVLTAHNIVCTIILALMFVTTCMKTV